MLLLFCGVRKEEEDESVGGGRRCFVVGVWSVVAGLPGGGRRREEDVNSKNNEQITIPLYYHLLCCSPKECEEERAAAVVVVAVCEGRCNVVVCVVVRWEVEWESSLLSLSLFLLSPLPSPEERNHHNFQYTEYLIFTRTRRGHYHYFILFYFILKKNIDQSRVCNKFTWLSTPHTHHHDGERETARYAVIGHQPWCRNGVHLRTKVACAKDCKG